MITRAIDYWRMVAPHLTDRPRWWRQVQLVVSASSSLVEVNRVLLNERLARLTFEEARVLYEWLAPTYRALAELLERHSETIAAQTVLRGWTKRVSREVERLGDIVEALAWGSDPDLRDYVKTRALEIHRQEGAKGGFTCHETD